MNHHRFLFSFIIPKLCLWVPGAHIITHIYIQSKYTQLDLGKHKQQYSSTCTIFLPLNVSLPEEFIRVSNFYLVYLQEIFSTDCTVLCCLISFFHPASLFFLSCNRLLYTNKFAPGHGWLHIKKERQRERERERALLKLTVNI